MQSRDAWAQRLSQDAATFGFTEGFKILYSPWKTMDCARAVFISLNPGKAPDDADMCMVSDERGNSYEVEQYTTTSPITAQFLKMCAFLGLTPADVLTGVASPFRSNKWALLTKPQQIAGLGVGRDFWREALARANPNLVVACSREAAQMAIALTGARQEATMAAGWGNHTIARHRSPDGTRVIHLPHLSQFKLFSRAESEPYLRAVFEI